MPGREYAVVPAWEAGYGFGSGWIVRYYDPEVQVWFDAGDPHDTKEAAQAAKDEWERTNP